MKFVHLLILLVHFAKAESIIGGSAARDCTSTVQGISACEKEPTVNQVHGCDLEICGAGETDKETGTQNLLLSVGSSVLQLWPNSSKVVLQCSSVVPLTWERGERQGSYRLEPLKTSESQKRNCFVSYVCVDVRSLQDGAGYICRTNVSQVQVSMVPESNKLHRRLDFSLNPMDDDGDPTFKCSSNGPEATEVKVFKCKHVSDCQDMIEGLEQKIIPTGTGLSAETVTAQTLRFGLAVCKTLDWKYYNYRLFLQLRPGFILMDPFSASKTWEDLMVLRVQTQKGMIYIGDDVFVDCYTTRFNFSHGPRILLMFSDNTTTIAHVVPHTDKLTDVIEGVVAHLSGVLKVGSEKNITAIGCEADYQGSYRRKMVPVILKQSTAPVITDYPEATKTFYDTDENVTLSCGAIGEPCPTVEWFKNGVPYTDNNQNVIKNTSTCVDGVARASLTFVKVSTDFGISAQGPYSCKAKNSGGSDEKHMHVYITGGPMKYLWTIPVVLALVFVGALLYAIHWAWRLIRQQQEEIERLKEAKIAEFEHGDPRYGTPEDLLYTKGNSHMRFEKVNSAFKLDDRSVSIDEPEVILGEGFFGEVLLGEYMHSPKCEPEKVAVKQLKEFRWNSSSVDDILDEIKILSHLNQGNHKYQDHIVKLIGYVAQYETEKVQIVMELCTGGNLETYLKRQKENVRSMDTVERPPPAYVIVGNSEPTIKDLISYAYQVACAMQVLHDRNIINGDLAARNVLLVDQSRRRVKLADFGLSRTIGHGSDVREKPYRSLAVECFEDGAPLTFESDIWAFGVLMYEIFSLGEIPYSNLREAYKIAEFLRNPRNRLERPQLTPFQIYETMKKCWLQNPADRPSFECLSKDLQDIMNSCNPATSITTPSAPQVLNGYVTAAQIGHVQVSSM